MLSTGGSAIRPDRSGRKSRGDICIRKGQVMRSSFDTNDYVKSLTVAGFTHAQSRQRSSEDAATLADLERLKAHIDTAAARAEADLARFRLLTFVGILMLCATILLLHFSRI